MITAIFEEGADYAEASCVWQWDYGQVLEIRGLSLPNAAEIHIGIERGSSTVTRIGMTSNGITTVEIPDVLLEQSRNLVVYLYLAGKATGKTDCWVKIPVRPRAKPDHWKRPEELVPQRLGNGCACIPHVPQHNKPGCRPEVDNPLHAAVEAAAIYVERAELAEKGAVEAAGCAKESAGIAGDKLKEIPGRVVAAKEEIDEYCKKKEAELKGETGNVNFASFAVIGGRLKMFSDPAVDKVRFQRRGSRLSYRLEM